MSEIQIKIVSVEVSQNRIPRFYSDRLKIQDIPCGNKEFLDMYALQCINYLYYNFAIGLIDVEMFLAFMNPSSILRHVSL